MPPIGREPRRRAIGGHLWQLDTLGRAARHSATPASSLQKLVRATRSRCAQRRAPGNGSETLRVRDGRYSGVARCLGLRRALQGIIAADEAQSECSRGGLRLRRPEDVQQDSGGGLRGDEVNLTSEQHSATLDSLRALKRQPVPPCSNGNPDPVSLFGDKCWPHRGVSSSLGDLQWGAS